MARSDPERLPWDCDTSDADVMLKTPLQGTIVGPGPEKGHGGEHGK
jgi:hypothetical protein